MYILTKLFVFDLIYVMAKFSRIPWFLNYKSLFWLVLGTINDCIIFREKALAVSICVIYPFILIL